MDVLIKKVSSPQELQHCFMIRIHVFVIGQGVPKHQEMDGQDKNSSHYLVFINEKPVGVARVRFIEDFAKIERVAILNEYQGKHLGKELMNYILNDLKTNKIIAKAKLSSQIHAIPFYEKLGFVVCSEEYMDANIPHKDMQLILYP